MDVSNAAPAQARSIKPQPDKAWADRSGQSSCSRRGSPPRATPLIEATGCGWAVRKRPKRGALHFAAAG